MRKVAVAEGVKATHVLVAVARGHAVIPLNPAHKGVRPVGVGRLFRTKVNANIGRSTERSAARGELRKLKVSLDAGADFVMRASGRGFWTLRRRRLARSLFTRLFRASAVTCRRWTPICCSR